MNILIHMLIHNRLVVVLVEKTFVYDLNTLTMLDTIDTAPNPKGRSEKKQWLGLRSMEDLYACIYRIWTLCSLRF